MKNLLIPVAIALLFIVGCGGGGGGDHVAVATDFSKAVYDQDWDKAKDLSTDASDQMIDMVAGMASMGESMGESMGADADAEKEPFAFNVLRDSVTEDGDKAFVFYDDGGEEKKMELTKEDGEWKVVFSKS